MTTNYLRIYYGPNEAFNVVCHRPQKLTGLRDHLRRLGYRVDIKPVHWLNFCVFEICGHEVFRCNINNLGFNMPVHLDVVAMRAVEAIQDASVKFNRARTYLWCWNMISVQMFKRSQYAPTDYFPFSTKVTPFDLECVKCCDLLIAKKEEDAPQDDAESVDSDALLFEQKLPDH